MKDFIVLYRTKQLTELENPFGFACKAEDVDHAEEQCENAYPGCDMVWVCEGTDYQAALQEYYDDMPVEKMDAMVVHPKLIVLCMDANGAPTFYQTAPECTLKQVADGEHYERAKDNAREDFYEDPMIVFEATDPAAKQIVEGKIGSWLTTPPKPVGRKVRVTLGIDVAAYASSVVTVPEGEDITEYLKAHSHKLGCDAVFVPDWTTSDGLRVVQFDDDATREELGGDIQIEPSEAQRVAMRYEARLQAARDVIKRHWDALEYDLPDEVLKDFNDLLKD